jgi:RHS repeat-associated protein
VTADRDKFTSRERDAESGLDNFGARYFASTMGRFMSPDWAAKAEPEHGYADAFRVDEPVEAPAHK